MLHDLISSNWLYFTDTDFRSLLPEILKKLRYDKFSIDAAVSLAFQHEQAQLKSQEGEKKITTVEVPCTYRSSKCRLRFVTEYVGGETKTLDLLLIGENKEVLYSYSAKRRHFIN